MLVHLLVQLNCPRVHLVAVEVLVRRLREAFDLTLVIGIQRTKFGPELAGRVESAHDLRLSTEVVPIVLLIVVDCSVVLV